MEVYSYEFSNSNVKFLIDELFKNIEIIEVSKTIADFSINIRKNRIKKIKLPDAIILATAKVLGIPLLTDDWDDFSDIDETVLISKIDFLKIYFLYQMVICNNFSHSCKSKNGIFCLIKILYK